MHLYITDVSPKTCRDNGPRPCTNTDNRHMPYACKNNAYTTRVYNNNGQIIDTCPIVCKNNGRSSLHVNINERKIYACKDNGPLFCYCDCSRSNLSYFLVVSEHDCKTHSYLINWRKYYITLLINGEKIKLPTVWEMCELKIVNRRAITWENERKRRDKIRAAVVH